MIIGTLTLLYFLFGVGGGSAPFAALLPSFEAAVSGARLDQIEVVLDDADANVAAFRDKVTGELSEQAMAVHRNYDATRADFQAIFDRVDADREALQKTLIEKRLRLRALLSAEEWAKYRAALTKARAQN